MTPYRRALLEALNAELASREAAPEVPTWDPTPFLSDAQRIRVFAPERFQSWPAGRQSGKTDGAEKKLLAVAADPARKGQQVIYASTSIKRAVATIWDEICSFNREHPELRGKENHSNHTISFPNAGKFVCTGVENKRMANDIRGRKKVALYFVDEAQDWDDELLKYFYEKVIFPSLSAVRGSVIFAGTGCAPHGFWYEVATGGVSADGKTSAGDGFKRFGPWSPFDNPYLAEGEAAALIAKACKDRGVDINDPSIRTEFFAEFIADTAKQIFPYDDAKNGFDELPPGDYYFVLGFDYGTVDACAGVVWAFREADPYRYVVEADALTGLGGGGQTAFCQAMIVRYPDNEVVAIVGDPGGGGKGVITDVRQDHGIPMESAKKTDKPAACIVLRDGLRSGTVKVKRSLKEFITELRRPEWDPDRVGEVVKGHMPDRCDAALYGYREVVGRHVYVEPPAPKTREELEADALIEQQEREESLMRDMGLR